MDLFSTIFSTGWASGVNAYATVALLGILGRTGVGDVPEPLQSDPAIAVASIMFLIEFVTDKVPYVDSLWDSVHTVIRPSIASVIGGLYGGDADLSGLEEAFAAGGSGATALASHGVKASLRLAINTSPEPASNIVVSLAEDASLRWSCCWSWSIRRSRRPSPPCSWWAASPWFSSSRSGSGAGSHAGGNVASPPPLP